jgi:aspartyl-tRNA(Asn)/glutamyl-tRNA(Gln) amidotransferase subunit B
MEKGTPALRRQRERSPEGRPEVRHEVEVKNLNSFRFVKLALDYEIARQVAVIEGGGTIVQETRLYDSILAKRGYAQQGAGARLSLLPEPDWCLCESAKSGSTA